MLLLGNLSCREGVEEVMEVYSRLMGMRTRKDMKRWMIALEGVKIVQGWGEERNTFK